MASGYEKVYEKSFLPIKYIYKKAENYDSDKLVIVFSALGPKPVYNYMRTLEGIDVNQLFILDDYGNRGCYYLGQYPEFLVEKSVISLIEHILKEYNIKPCNVICGGSSKGGTAALYFAIKCKLGNVIIAEPQIRIAKYLQDYEATDVLNYIIREGEGKYTYEDSEVKISKLNEVIYDLIKEEEFWPSLTIHAGNNTYYYKEHIKEFLSFLYSYNKKVKLDLKDYSNHSDLIKYYPDLLVNGIFEKFQEIREQLYIRKVNSDVKGNKIKLEVDGNNINEVAWYVYLDNKKIFTQWYEKKDWFEYNADLKGKYSFMVFAQDKYGNKIAKKTAWLEI